MPNIFDIQQEIEEPVTVSKKQASPLAGFIAATISLAFLAVTAPIYIHLLVEIVNWSWNLI
jgi:hypothetical protein